MTSNFFQRIQSFRKYQIFRHLYQINRDRPISAEHLLHLKNKSSKFIKI